MGIPFDIPLFEWRGSATTHSCSWDDEEVQEELRTTLDSAYAGAQLQCPFCRGPYSHTYSEAQYKGDHRTHDWRLCKLCGFWFKLREKLDLYGGPDDWYLSYAVLRDLHINGAELPLSDLGRHLKDNFRDIYSLPPRVFERLVGDVYRALGFEVSITRATRDGGYDLVVLNRNDGEKMLVEIKRYRRGKKVDVSVVRQLLGVQLMKGVSKAAIVTTSEFTQPAQEAAEKSARAPIMRCDLELVDAHALLAMLDVYADGAKPLNEDRRFQ